MLSTLPQVEFVIKNARIDSQTNGTNGGAVFFSNTYWVNPLMRIINCSISRSNAANGGAVYFNLAQDMLIENSTFFLNTGARGGAAYIQNSRTMRVNKNQFLNCSSSSEGGSLHINQCYEIMDVKHCLFQSCRTISNGGAIRIYLDVGIVYFQDCIFNNCSASTGGAVYIDYNHHRSQIFIDRVCGYMCHAPSSGNFMNFNLGTVYNNITSWINMSSINYCSNVQSSSGSIFHSGGNFMISEINSSFNSASSFSSIYFNPQFEGTIRYSTIANNSASSYTLYIQSNMGYKSYMSYCNIFFNTVTSSTSPIIGLIGKSSSASNGTIIQNCIFYNNQGTLFSIVSYGTHTINDCHIMHNAFYYTIFTSQSVTVNTNQIIIAISPTISYKLTHYNTRFCPSAPNIEPQAVTPCPTLPPLPSTCIIETNSQVSDLGLSSILHFLEKSVYLVLIS